mgnify:CR=1 FL=1
MARYQIWDKKSSVITPSGEVFTPEQWADRYPMARIEGVDLVIAGGTINGAFCGEYSSMKEMYLREGCDFSDCETKQDCLDVIEAFEDLRGKGSDEPTNEDIIASSLAFMAMQSASNVDIDEEV